MTAEVTTPVPVTLAECMRFVFFFKPHPVADTFDNIPLFHLDIVEKKDLENHQRLYITCKVLPDVWFLDADGIDTKALQLSIALKDYLKKHFGSKFTIIESMMRSLPESLPSSTREILQAVLNRKQLINEEVVTDHFTASKRIDAMNMELIRISPALLGSYRFQFWDNRPLIDTPYTVLRGRAILFGEPMFFEVENMSDYLIERDAFLQFVTPRLIEDTLNRTLRITHDKPAEGKEIYIHDVELDDD